MNDRDIDERLGELLRREVPIPEHGEGYRERVAALLVAEDVARTEPKRWWLRRARPTPSTTEESRVVVTPVPRRPTRSPRLALAFTLAFLLLLVAFVGVLAPLQRLLNPTVVLRITDETIVDVQDPSATQRTVVATSFVSLNETKELVHDLLDAINADDTLAVGKFYATNGWLENDVGDIKIQGSVGIANYWRDAYDRLRFQVEPEGDPIPYDRYIAQPVRYLLPNEVEARTGVLVFQIDTNGQVARQWIIGWVGQ